MLQSYDMPKNNITQNHWHRVSFPYPRAEAHLNQPRSTLRPRWGTPLTPGIALWSPNQRWQPLGCSWSCFVPVPPFTLSSAHLLQLMQCHRHEQRAPSTAQLINKGKLIPALGWPYSPDRHQSGTRLAPDRHQSGSCPGPHSTAATTNSIFLWQHPAIETSLATKTMGVSQKLHTTVGHLSGGEAPAAGTEWGNLPEMLVVISVSAVWPKPLPVRALTENR